MTYTPKFSMTRRNGKIALWVEMPDKQLYNIWDIAEKQYTPEIGSAIVSAFERGWQARCIAQKEMSTYLLIQPLSAFYNEVADE